MGPNGTSILEKLGFQRAHLMPKEALLDLVRREQARRSAMRAIGRVLRSNKGKSPKKIQRLEDVGLSPQICDKLRAKYKQPDLAIIQLMQEKGLL